MNRVRIATRKSALALWQAHHVRDRLKAQHSGLEVELVPIVTRGDRILDRPLAEIGGKGLFLKELQELGFAGIQNFPTVGLIEGRIRDTLEETGMSYQLEVDVVKLANDMDMLTTPYVFNTDEAKRMTEAGADIVVAHMGCTSGGTIGAESVSPLEECVGRVQEIVDTCKSIRDDVIMLCHGGPIAMPDDAKFMIENVKGIDGFYGASSTERFPTEVAIRKQIEDFKAIKLPR